MSTTDLLAEALAVHRRGDVAGAAARYANIARADPANAVWMRLLHSVKDAVLWLLEGNPTASANLRHQAEKRGISPHRLIALALKLACDSSYFASIKARLAQNRELFPLFNTERFTRHMEAAYETMLELHKGGETLKLPTKNARPIRIQSPMCEEIVGGHRCGE